MIDSTNELESSLGPSAGCTGPLEATAAGCVQAESEGQPGDLPADAVDSTGRASAKAADVEPDRPQPPQTLRAFELALRQKLNYSQRQAAAIARDGFRPAMAEPEAEREPDLSTLLAALQRRAAALKG
jgi:hypothetical protein